MTKRSTTYPKKISIEHTGKDELSFMPTFTHETALEYLNEAVKALELALQYLEAVIAFEEGGE